ncbi:MAG: hypothetical protein Kow0099_08370 [Candidatus Abyssubacteria bacterium]
MFERAFKEYSPKEFACPLLIAAYLLVIFHDVFDLFFVQDDFWFLYGAKYLAEHKLYAVKGFLPEFVRPLPTYWFFRVGQALWGVNPDGYHFAQIAFHIIAALAIYYLIKSLTRDPLIALLGAIVYGSSRLHIFTLTWVSGVIENLLLMFFGLALLFHARFLHSKKAAYSVLCCFFFAGALLSKENAVVIPLILLAHRLSWRKKWVKDEVLHFGLIFLLLAAYALMRTTLTEDLERGLIFNIARPLALFSYGMEALFPYPGFGRAGMLHYLVTFGSWGVVLRGCLVRRESAKHLPVFVLGVTTIALPISLFSLTSIPKDLSPYYSTMSLVGFSLLAAYAVWIVKGWLSHWKRVGSLNYALIAITVAYACAAAWTINRELRAGNYASLTQEKLSSLAFKQLNQVVRKGALSRLVDGKVIVFDNLTSRMYLAMGYGRMLDVMFPELDIAYYFLDSEEVKGNLGSNDPLLQQENTLLLKQVNRFYFDNWEPRAYRYGAPLEFGWSGNYMEYEAEGWSDPEGEFTWTDGTSANLLIPLQPTETDIELKTRLRPFLVPGKLDSQRIIVRVNGEQVAEWTLTHESTARRGLWELLTRAAVFHEHTAVIPKRLLQDSHALITFELPDAVRPIDLGASDDQRTLGAAIKSIVLIEPGPGL